MNDKIGMVGIRTPAVFIYLALRLDEEESRGRRKKREYTLATP